MLVKPLFALFIKQIIKLTLIKMCKLIKEYTKFKSCTGYKAAYKDKNGNYSSPATGVPYKTGPVIKRDESHSRPIGYFKPGLGLDKDTFQFNPLMLGRTAIFKRKLNAFRLRRRILNSLECNHLRGEEIVVLKMRLKKELYEGSYISNGDVFAGKHIISIEEITK